MSTYQNESIRVREEACTHRFHSDCRQIEDRQDSIKEQRRVLQEIEEQMAYSARQSYDYYHNYEHTNDPQLYHQIIASQNRITFAQAESDHLFTEHQEELALEERRLARKLEEREDRYKAEMRALDKE